MKIKRVVKNTQDGNLEATMVLTPGQVAWLINLALLTLIEKGALELNDVNEQGEKVTTLLPENSIQEKQDAHFEDVES